MKSKIKATNFHLIRSNTNQFVYKITNKVHKNIHVIEIFHYREQESPDMPILHIIRYLMFTNKIHNNRQEKTFKDKIRDLQQIEKLKYNKYIITRISLICSP